MVSGMSGGGASAGDSIETLYVDIAARADQLVTDATQAVNQVMGQLNRMEESAQKQGSTWKALGGFVTQAFSVATGIGFANMTSQVINKVVGLGKQLISSNAQMQMFQRSFEVLTGSAEEAGEIIEWVREQAKATPFDVPGLIQASQQLMTWGLDLKEWFTVVGDVAAGMQRPISQVVNAVGTLATGQTGEAVRRFRDLGINLREFQDQLAFDARGAMITPLEEAIPIVRQIMIDRFGGMMESQSDTWEGVMSNMSDTWQQFIQVVGEPLFEVANEQLKNLYSWIEENQDAIESFAVDLGRVLGDALTIMVDLVNEIGSFLGFVRELIDEIPQLAQVMELIRPGEAFGTARKIAAIGYGPTAGAIRTVSGLVSGKEQVEDLDDVMKVFKRNWLDSMNQIAGVTEEANEPLGTQVELLKEGLEAVRLLGGAYTSMTDSQITWNVVLGESIQGMAALFRAYDQIIPGYGQFADALEQSAEVAQTAADAYSEAAAEVDRLAAAASEAEAELAKMRAEFEASLELAVDKAPDLTEALREGLEELANTAAEAQAISETALNEISAKAAEAQQAAIAANQQAIAKLREQFARDQIKKQQQFNRAWARLLREQHDANVDAEAAYQLARENLLIEGDEIALAELEQQHGLEKQQRERDQGQAQGDFQERMAVEMAAAQERFDAQVAALEDRLREEIEKIRQAAEEQRAAQVEKDQEKNDEIEANKAGLNQKLGEMLAAQVGDNEVAARFILDAWAQMYDGLEVEAIWTAYTAELEMNRIIEATVRAMARLYELQTLISQVRSQQGRVYLPADPVQYQTGGYTPGVVRPITTHPGEFVNTAATTSALERATGGPLTQQSVRNLAEFRKRMDVFLHGSGVSAKQLGAIRTELVQAFKQEGMEF